MAIKLSSHKCSDCSGKLEFNKLLKRFECPYCGKVYEKELEAEVGTGDDLSSTNSVIRVTLLNLASNEMDDAKKNLLECEKLNPNYIGTKIANICYYRFLTFYSDGQTSNSAVAKLKYYYEEIRKEPNIDEDERSMYDCFANPDIYAVVYITLISVNLQERASYVANFLDFNKVVNVTLNKYMLKIALQAEAIKEADQILENVNFIDKKHSMFQLLKYYPDLPMKRNHILRLFQAKALSYQDDAIVKKYLAETKDCALTKMVVVVESLKIRMRISMSEILKNLLVETNEETVEEVFSNLEQIKLSDSDTSLLLDYILGNNCNSKKTIILGLTSLKNNGSLFDIQSKYVIQIIEKKGMLAEDKIEILDFIYDTFRMTNKNYEAVLNYALVIYADKEQRAPILECVLQHSTDISFTTLTDYLYDCTFDGDRKIDILESVFSLNISKVYFQDLLSNYATKCKDAHSQFFAIAKLISKYDKKLVGTGASRMISNIETEDEAIFVFSLDTNIPSNALDEYITNNTVFSDFVIQKLVDARCNLSDSSLRKFIMQGKSSAKADIVKLLIGRNHSIDTSASYSCKYNGDSITCNFVQLYLFSSKDEPAVKVSISKNLIALKMKLSENMIVNQKKISFKKYILGLKAADTLDSEMDNICNELSVYKMFF